MLGAKWLGLIVLNSVQFIRGRNWFLYYFPDRLHGPYLFQQSVRVNDEVII